MVMHPAGVLSRLPFDPARLNLHPLSRRLAVGLNFDLQNGILETSHCTRVQTGNLTLSSMKTTFPPRSRRTVPGTTGSSMNAWLYCGAVHGARRRSFSWQLDGGLSEKTQAVDVKRICRIALNGPGFSGLY
eukprot:1934968-Rhodomonas_salina.3